MPGPAGVPCLPCCLELWAGPCRESSEWLAGPNFTVRPRAHSTRSMGRIPHSSAFPALTIAGTRPAGAYPAVPLGHPHLVGPVGFGWRGACALFCCLSHPPSSPVCPGPSASAVASHALPCPALPGTMPCHALPCPGFPSPTWKVPARPPLPSDPDPVRSSRTRPPPSRSGSAACLCLSSHHHHHHLLRSCHPPSFFPRPHPRLTLTSGSIPVGNLQRFPAWS